MFAFPHNGMTIAYLPPVLGTVAVTRIRLPRPAVVHGVGAEFDVHGVPPASSQKFDDQLFPSSLDDAMLILMSVPTNPFWDCLARVAASDCVPPIDATRAPSRAAA